MSALILYLGIANCVHRDKDSAGLSGDFTGACRQPPTAEIKPYVSDYVIQENKRQGLKCTNLY